MVCQACNLFWTSFCLRFLLLLLLWTLSRRVLEFLLSVGLMRILYGWPGWLWVTYIFHLQNWFCCSLFLSVFLFVCPSVIIDISVCTSVWLFACLSVCFCLFGDVASCCSCLCLCNENSHSLFFSSLCLLLDFTSLKVAFCLKQAFCGYWLCL